MGCFQRFKDDRQTDEARENEMELVVKAEVVMHNMTHAEAKCVMRSWRNSYYAKTKTDKMCSWMCFFMNKDQTKKMMIQHQRQRNQVCG